MNKKRWVLNIVFTLSLLNTVAQDWNPYVSQAIISPAPLTPWEYNGTGTASFKFGNSGSSALNFSLGNEILLKITFSYGVPYNAAAVDPFNPTQAEAVAVISGSAISYFNWSYDPGTKTFEAIQKNAIAVPGNFEGTVIIPYKVTINSSISQLQNGFNVNLTPPGYTGGINSTDDDQASSYTWVEVKDFGDAPASYGSVSHMINIYKDSEQAFYENYMFLGASVDPESTDQTSANADGDDNNGTDDEDGVVFPTLTRGVNVNIPVNITIVDGDISGAFGRLSAWIDWNGDGDFLDLGERIATNIVVDNGTLGGNSGTVLINVTVPIDATTSPTFARFRFGNSATSPTNIPGTNWGEVEDYQITILCVAPTATINSQTNISCFGGSNGAIDLSVSGATAPYTYLWSPGGATTQDISGLTAGTYTVTVTEAGGCKTTASATITQPTAISANAVASPSTCGNANGSVNLTVSGGTPSYSYLWSNGATTEDLSGLVANTYTVTVTDANGCTKTASATVNNANGPTATITSQTNVLCNGSATGSINLTVTGGTPAYTYLWSNGATTEDISGLVANTYTVTVTDANLCKSTASTTITQPTAISANAVASPSTCGNANGSVNLTVSGGTPSYSYLWSNGATTEDLSGLVANTYTVTVTDANGCTKTASATVNNANGPTATITSQTNVLCNGSATGSINLTVTGGTPAYTYLWSNGATTEDLSGLVANTYTVTVTDANLCKSTASTTITQPTAISANAVASQSTCGNANGSVNLTVSGGTPSYSYLWSNGATTEDISGLVANTYTVTVTDANGCTKTASASVINNNASCNTDLSITKSGQARVSPGEIITYIITVIVSTDGAAQNVVITDAVPAIIEGVQYSLDGISGWTNWTGSYNAGTLSAGTTFSLYLRGTVGLLACDLINNSASVTTSTTETNNSNNTSNIVSTAVYQPGTNIILANYNFAGAAAYPYNANQTAPGITSSVTSSESFVASGSGTVPGGLAFDNTAAAGESLAMQPSTGNNTRYFQFIISGANLANYSKFELYLQASLSSGTGLLTFAYSTDGINFFNNSTKSIVAPNTWYESVIDWKGVMALNTNTLSSLYIRIYPSGVVGDATRLEIDNFQVRGLQTLSPVICGPLPATGMELSVNLQNNYTSHLKWYTLSEQNTDHFEVERSLDGRTFTSIKSNIKAAGTSFSRIDYAYDDDISTLASQKVIYYRVKLVDKDGTFSYTNIVVVRLSIKEGISVWPNPFTTNLTVSINTSVVSHYSMKLMTITGQQLMTKKIKVSPGTNVISLQNLEKFANGTYVLFIENETNSSVHVEKLVKL